MCYGYSVIDSFTGGERVSRTIVVEMIMLTSCVRVCQTSIYQFSVKNSSTVYYLGDILSGIMMQCMCAATEPGGAVMLYLA